tara:strand:- start:1605 stop:1790 length:186 start_codon:yes stop_codon:yes gene_type:complete
MRIALKNAGLFKGVLRKKGAVVEVSSAEGRQYISNGTATEVKETKPKKSPVNRSKKASAKR